MRYGAALISACVLVSIAPGCSLRRAETDPAPTTGPDPAEQVKSLREENQELRNRNKILSARLEEWAERDKHLSERISRLAFLNEGRREQIRTLADAPAERDAYRKKSEKLALEAARLRKRIAELEKLIAALRSSPPPTTQPTAP